MLRTGEERVFEPTPKPKNSKPRDLLIQVAQNGFFVVEQEPFSEKLRKAYDNEKDVPSVPFVFETVQNLTDFLTNYYR